MFPSLEVRWFGPGTAPGPLARLARPSPGDLGQGRTERRTDHYLLQATTSLLGIKVRAGADFEVKLRTQDLGPIELHEGVEGRLEAWSKWSFPLEGNDQEDLGAGAWIGVEKIRVPRKFAAARRGVREVPSDESAPRGCTVELTALTVAGTRWWTFGFEAFGPKDALEASLRAAAAAVFAEDPPGAGPLRIEDSLSYPAWLATVHAH